MFFKRKVLEALELNNARLRSIDLELQGIRHAILNQTKLLERSKKAPKEAAPAPEAITWQEVVRVLVGTAKGHCKTCELQKVCATNFRMCAEDWEVPANE